ncbi:MAG: hypothetical protein IJX87_03185 [Clostridia bacterium]|nr:hypothetical protein [Clostridia bacterium]
MLKRKSVLGLLAAVVAVAIPGFLSLNSGAKTAQADEYVGATKIELSADVNSTYWGERSLSLILTYPHEGNNQSVLYNNLFPWVAGIEFNGETPYAQTYKDASAAGDVGRYSGTYFVHNNLSQIKIWVNEEDYKNAEINELVLPAGLTFANGVKTTAEETWYGRYGVWSKDKNALPAENDPNYVGTIESIDEPYGVVTPEMGGLYNRKIIVKFTLPAAVWGNGDSPAQQANDDRLGKTLYDLRRKVLINGGQAVEESQIGSTWYYPEKQWNWQTLNMVISDRYRDPHGEDVITFPELRLADGRIIKETNFYYYYDIKEVKADGSVIYDDIWHAQPKDLAPAYSFVTETADAWTGSLTFERDCASANAAFTQAEKVLLGDKTAAEWNANGEVATFTWTGANELSYTLKKSAFASIDKLALTLKAGFVFPSEETLRADYTKYYVASERFWVSSTEEISLEQYDLAHVVELQKPVAQAGGAYQITVKFSGLLVASDTYVRMANVTADMYTLYTRSLAQQPGYYYAQKAIYMNGAMTDIDGVSVADRSIRLGIRNSVLDNVKINGKTVREMLAAETAENLAKDCIQIDFYEDQMQIYITGQSANKLENVEGLRVEIGAGVRFHSGRQTSVATSYQYKNGAWKTYVEEENVGGEENLTAVTNAIALIDAIPAYVTIADKAAVTAAKTAYDALTAEEKAQISQAKLNKLNGAIAAIETLENPPQDEVVQPSEGCNSTLGVGLVGLTVLAAAAVALRKKED